MADIVMEDNGKNYVQCIKSCETYVYDMLAQKFSTNIHGCLVVIDTI